MEGTASVSMLNTRIRFSVHSGLVQEYYGILMADLGGQMGATATPFHDENSALAPPFCKKSALILTHMHSFQSLVLNAGNI